MSDYHVDGTLIVARLKRNVPGGALFDEIVVRREDGTTVSPGMMRVTSPMLGVMVPGTRGRFYFHDVVGTKGMHGFRGADGASRFHFPTLFIWGGAILGLLNLSMVATWLLTDGSLRPIAFFFAVASFVMATLFFAARQGARRRFAADMLPGKSSARRPAIA